MRVVLIMLFFTPLLSRGQEFDSIDKTARLSHYLNVYDQSETGSKSVHPVINFADKLARKRESIKDDDIFLEYLFQRTHQRFLTRYQVDASFGQLFRDRSFNCLTATALYALLLDHFDFDYKIIETNYHIFLITQTNKGPVLFETTDPANGYVNDPREIQKRIALYKENRVQLASGNKRYYQFTFDLYNGVTLDQMQGLLYYNLAVDAYNHQNLPLAIQQLKKATKLYRSPRIDEFSKILLISVTESISDKQQKEEYIRNIKALRSDQFNITASSN